MIITRIRIGLLASEDLRLEKRTDWPFGLDETAPIPSEDENNYWAEAIEDGDKFCYRVDGVTVEITEDELFKVVINPSLYYFSTALKLHIRIKQASGEF